MEKDTVVISVDRFLELRDFQEKMIKGVTYRAGMYGTTYISTDVAIAEITNKLEDANDEIDAILKEKLSAQTIATFKEMTWWQFLKWRNSQK